MFAVSLDLIHDIPAIFAVSLYALKDRQEKRQRQGGKQVIKSTDKLEIVVEFVYSRQQKMILKSIIASYGWKCL